MRKPALLVPLGRRLVVGRFLVGGEKAAEGDRGSRCAELDVRSVLCRTEPKRERDPARVVHLRRHGPLPDELVERKLVAAQLARDLPRRAKAVACRANRLVRLLRVLDLALVAARSLGDVLGAVQLGCLAARGPERRLRERGRVGAHVRDVAVVVEPLGDPHRGLGAEAELSARLLLQRRGHERRGRAARVRLLLGRAEREGRGGESLRESPSRRLVEDDCVLRLQRPVLGEVAPLSDALAVDGDQPRLEAAAGAALAQSSAKSPLMSQ